MNMLLQHLYNEAILLGYVVPGDDIFTPKSTALINSNVHYTHPASSTLRYRRTPPMPYHATMPSYKNRTAAMEGTTFM